MKNITNGRIAESHGLHESLLYVSCTSGIMACTEEESCCSKLCVKTLKAVSKYQSRGFYTGILRMTEK
jgi:hypothetical protein